MTDDNATPKLGISHSEVHGLVQQNYGTVTFVYNFPQNNDVLKAEAAGRLDMEAPDCPYQGLSAFQPEDAGLFFGRDAAVDRVVRLTQRGRLTAVTGASGSGKSSLVFAGVLPALMQTDKWVFTTFRPGEDPLYSLAGALAPMLADTEPGVPLPATEQAIAVAALAADLRSDPARLSAVIQRIHDRNPGKQILIFADQFEELYSLAQEDEVRNQFLDRYLGLAASTETPFLRLLLTIRADFLGELVGERRLADALQNQIDLLGPMTRQELTDAVVLPAESMGVRYEDHLVERILDDLGDDDGSLPLLEFALTQLWEKQSVGSLLTHTEYEEVGRVSGAIRQHAEAAYARLDQEERRLTRRLFRRLVSLPDQNGHDSERITRRQVDLQSLDTATQVLAKGELANRRLVIISRVSDQRDTVEIVHEALLTNWPELATWIKEDRETILRLQALSVATAAYSQSDNNPDLLYRGNQLREYLDWADKHASELTAAETAFLAAGRHIERRRSVAQYGGYALAIVVPLLVVVWFLSRPPREPEVPYPMPEGDFNIAVASFDVEGVGAVADNRLVADLERDKEAIADEFYAALKELESEFESALGGDINVNILSPDRFELANSSADTVAEQAQYMNANILVYGSLQHKDGRYWNIVPRFYIDHSATQDRAAEIMEEQALVQAISFIPDHMTDLNEAVSAQSASLEVLFALYRGLDLYDQGSIAAYESAAEVFCDSSTELRERGTIKGVDILALFCGHSYSELLILSDNEEEARIRYIDYAVRAYERAIDLNSESLRARVSLGAFLISVYQPDLSCEEGALEQILEAKAILEAAEPLVDSTADVRQGTEFGYLLNRGHALFWFGLCSEPSRIAEHWKEAHDFYQRVVVLSEIEDSGRADITDFDVAQAYAQMAYIDLVAGLARLQGISILDDLTENPLGDAAIYFDKSLGLLFPHRSEPRIAKYTNGLAIHSIHSFCRAGNTALAQTRLAQFSSLAGSWSRASIIAEINKIDRDLRKECEL